MKQIILTITLLIASFPALAADKYLAVASRGAGANGTFFQTDVRIVNLASSSVTLTLTLYPSGAATGTPIVRTVTLAARSSAELNDITSLFGIVTGGGAIKISSPGEFSAVARTFTPSERAGRPGTYGQPIPVLSLSVAVTRGVVPNVQLSSDPASGFRTNAGFFNPGTSEVAVALNLRNGDGSLLRSAAVTLAPLTQIQNSVAQLFGVPEVTTTNAFLEISASSPIFAYTSVIDNASGDPIFLMAEPDPGTPASGMTMVAKQWSFEPSTLEVKAGEIVTIQVRALDVDHGIAFSGVGPMTCSSQELATDPCILRPNQTVTVSFTPREKGTFGFFCTRFCDSTPDGSESHFTMRGTLVVR